MDQYDSVRRLIDTVRSRWIRMRAFRATIRAALAGGFLIGVMLVGVRWMTGYPGVLAAATVVTLGVAFGAALWFLAPLRRRPSDAQVARFIEERAPQLEDRLATAVDAAAAPAPTPFRDLAIADAARRAERVEIDTVVPADRLRRAGLQAAATLAFVAIMLFAGREPARQALDAASLTFFPARTSLEVAPGHARIKAGTALDVRARLVGNRAPVIAQLQIADAREAAAPGSENLLAWRPIDMASDGGGRFHLQLNAVTAPFTYRVVAGSVTSPPYTVAVVHAPRVTRIDVDYTYPAGLGLQPRTEQDSGDIYAPAGTDVRIRVLTDRPAASGGLALGDGQRIPLSGGAAGSGGVLSASLKVVDDNSYRITVADGEGMATSGDTEYFIRTLEDRPPDVRILKPAADRAVTRLDEVDIEAQAEDDYGVDRLDLVYVLRDKEQVVPLAIDRRNAFVKGRHMLFLEELDVQPGDFIAYYARARDLTRGTRPNEARSDIFFLEVRPFEQEFALAQSQAAAGAGGRSSIDDLVTAEKDIVISTFKLDRRAQSAKGARSEQDIRSVSRAQSELKTRVEQMSSTFRESTMRDPRRRPQGRGGSPPPEPRAGDALPEEDDMAAAAAAMGAAIVALDALKTGPALAPEMEALNHLLKAQADVKKREVQRQQAGSGAGNNRSNVDVSALFDRELKKQQQTNYETKSSAEQREDPNQSALDKIKDLAERQDALNRKLQDLARNRDRMSEEELRRELEKLTREQSELRQRAEDVARQMQNQDSRQSSSQQSASQSQQSGSQSQQSQQGQEGRGGQAGRAGRAGDNADRAKDASEAMRNAASDLRRQDPKQASASGSKALDELRRLQRQLESNRPDERRRAVGDLQLEARQLADAQRQIASDLGRAQNGDAGNDALRRLAGEQGRLAERARRLQNGLKQQGAAASLDSRATDRPSGRSSQSGNAQTSAAGAAQEMERQRVAERMQESADALRAASAAPAGRGRAPAEEAKSQAASGRDLAKAIDRLADTLASASGAGDADSRKLSDQRSRAQDLREQLARSGAEMDRLARQDGGRSGGRGQAGQSSPSGAAPPGASESKAPGQTGRAGEGQQGGGGGTGTDLAKLREDYARALNETRQLLEELRKQDPAGQTFARGGAGFTFENQGGMTLSAPGTEAFKQDYARWEDLRRQATQALESAESALGKQIQAKQAKDRLAAGVDDKAPSEYQKQVDSYFKAIAKKKS